MLAGMDPRPVGMFDSGVGGLSVLREFRRLAPRERTVYFADTAWFPYGPRDPGEVRKRAFAITHRLVDVGAKLVVVACNTASAAAIADLRQLFDLPFVGMVPAVKPAARASRSGRVAILATPGTFDGDLYASVVDEFGKGAAIDRVAGHDLADLVERGEVGTPAAREAVRSALAHTVANGADVIVLGCTHYEFLAPAITTEFPGIAVLGTGEPVAKRAGALLAELDLEAPPDAEGAFDLIVSGNRQAFLETLPRLGFSPREQEAEAQP